MAGVSVRRVEDITEALWETKVSPGTISNLNKKAYEHIEEWRCRPLTEEYPYVYVDGIYLKRSWGGEVQNVAVLVAIGVNEEGYCSRGLSGCQISQQGSGCEPYAEGNPCSGEQGSSQRKGSSSRAETKRYEASGGSQTRGGRN